MAKEQQLTDRAEWFRRPSTKREVTEGKKTETPVSNFYSLVEALAERERGELIIYEGDSIIPETFYSPQNFAKRGKVVMLDTFQGNVRRLRSERRSELSARIEASERYRREEGPYTGWAWQDPEKRMHIVRPSVVVEGHRIHHAAFVDSNIKEKVQVYNAEGSHTNAISVKVPSRSTDATHQVVIENVPQLAGDEKYVAWTRIASRHDCKAKRNDFTFRWGGGIVTYCAHDVAAYVTYSRKVAEATEEVIPQIFPMFTEPVLRLFMGAAYHTLVKDRYREAGKMHYRMRPMSFPEVDALIMDAWLKEGNKQTMFVRHPKGAYKTGRPLGQRKRMRDYAWFDKDAPGLAFGNE